MSDDVTVQIERLDNGRDLPLPAYQSTGAAGLDLYAAVAEAEPVTINPGMRTLVPTGLRLALPPTMEAQIRPRSGLALKKGVTVLNSPGTVDSDYRGEVSVILINFGQEPFTIKRGDRIAQMVVAPIVRCRLQETHALETTERGAGGFGSSGTGTSEHG
ncbi:MAG: dUTP diphosphatase [Pseudomonadota bacterium]